MPHDAADNEPVGYGNPPRRTRFQQGRSGNPAGRPKGSLNLATSLSRILTEPVVVTQQGQRRTITKFEAALTQLVNQAASGQPAAQALLLRYLLPVLEQALLNTTAGDQPAWPEADRQVMTRLLTRLKQVTTYQGGSDHGPVAS